MTDDPDEQLAFALMPTLDGSAPILSVGIPAAAWRRMQSDESTHTIDLTKIGLPFRLLLFSAPTREAAFKLLMDTAKSAGIAVLDERRRDFSIEPGTGKPKG